MDVNRKMTQPTTIAYQWGVCDGRFMKPFHEQMVEFEARRLAARVTDRELSIASGGIAEATISRYRCGVMEPRVSQWARLNDALEALIAERASTLDELLSQ